MFSINKKLQLLTILLSIATLLSGCSLPFAKKVNQDNWQNEIAMAKECGMDGLQCCADQDPSCQYGLECCHDPNDSKLTMCSENCNCGENNNFCCQDDPKCGEGMACFEGTCKECGEKNQPCCGGETQCDVASLICSTGKCFECGLAGNPCCREGLACLEENQQAEKRTECKNDFCEHCGSIDQGLCAKNPYCQKGLLPNNGQCILCGGLNQPCCIKNSDKEYICNPDLKLECVKGFCSKK